MLRTATISGVVAPRNFCPERNFLAGGQSRRLVEVDRHYDDGDVVWQEEVYIFARGVAEEMQPARVVDIGTGTGVKLQTAFAGHAAAKLQVDWRDERAALPGDTSQPAFVAVNLEDFADLEALEGSLDAREPTLFILSDVIEHLRDPRPVLRSLRRLLKRNPDNRLVISTPDRHRVDGAGAEGMPNNRGHVRQWTLNEFGLAMMSAGFKLHRIGRLPQNRFDKDDRNVCCELSCTPEFHVAWLRDHALPPPGDHMVVTTEHARADRTGGIGTYIKLAEEADGQPRVILFAGAMGLPEHSWWEVARSRDWIHVSDMCGRTERPFVEITTPDPDEILAATLQAIFLYDDIRLIEYQDYLGVGYRIAQAKRAGLLPRSVTVLAYAHGNHLYLDAAAGTISQDRALRIDARERLSIELADLAAFPSRYLRDLYERDGGFTFREQRYLPYPISLAPIGLDDVSRGPIRNLVFYGKQTPQKGYPDFVEAVLALFDDPAHAAAAAQVNRVVLMGITTPDPRLTALPIIVEHGVWSRAEALAMLRRFAADSLLVLPYRGDNHPLSVFEVVDFDCQLLAFDAGGLPELLPEALHQNLLCAPNSTALASGMARALGLTHWDRCRLLDSTRFALREAYLRHTETYKATMAMLKLGPSNLARTQNIGAVTVIVPNLNGTFDLLEDAALGLRNSFHRPAKVLLVDDGSTPEGLLVLERAVDGFGDIPTELVRNTANLGLAAARNVGLALVETPYVCPHDNDNIVLNRYLQIACRILDENPDVAAVTTWSWVFEHGHVWQRSVDAGGYRPFGADLGMAMYANIVGDALGVYRVSDLRHLGGWNANSKAKWEDWELFARLIAAGKNVWVIPQEHMLYRIRPTSMLRTYADFPGWLRLANVIPGLPPSQAIALLRGIWTPSYEESGDLLPYARRIAVAEAAVAASAAAAASATAEAAAAAETTAAAHASTVRQYALELQRLRSIEESTIWRASYRIRKALDRAPGLKTTIRIPLAMAWRGARAVKNLVRRG